MRSVGVQMVCGAHNCWSTTPCHTMQGQAAVDNKNSAMEVKHTRVGSTAVVRREPAAWERAEATSSSTRDMHCVGVCVCVCVQRTHTTLSMFNKALLLSVAGKGAVTDVWPW
jgi:hypothetical protein